MPLTYKFLAFLNSYNIFFKLHAHCASLINECILRNCNFRNLLSLSQKKLRVNRTQRVKSINISGRVRFVLCAGIRTWWCGIEYKKVATLMRIAHLHRTCPFQYSTTYPNLTKDVAAGNNTFIFLHFSYFLSQELLLLHVLVITRIDAAIRSRKIRGRTTSKSYREMFVFKVLDKWFSCLSFFTFSLEVYLHQFYSRPTFAFKVWFSANKVLHKST